MKLYEVNDLIQHLLDSLGIDPETGEIVEEPTDETLWDELLALQMERDRILDYLVKAALNARSEACAIKEEEKRLKARRERLENRDKRLVRILDRECGEKTDFGIATLSYRKSESLDVKDSQATIKWLKEHGYGDCIKYPEPEVMKDPVKKLLKKENNIPGVELVSKNNASLK